MDEANDLIVGDRQQELDLGLEAVSWQVNLLPAPQETLFGDRCVTRQTVCALCHCRATVAGTAVD